MRTGIFVLDLDTVSVPDTWTVFQCSGRWRVLYPDWPGDLGDVVFVRLLSSALPGNRAAFMVVASAARLQQLRGVADYANTVRGLRSDNGAAATAIRAAIIDDRSRDEGSSPIGELVALRGEIGDQVGGRPSMIQQAETEEALP